jgi:hypothetical protein
MCRFHRPAVFIAPDNKSKVVTGGPAQVPDRGTQKFVQKCESQMFEAIRFPGSVWCLNAHSRRRSSFPHTLLEPDPRPLRSYLLPDILFQPQSTADRSMADIAGAHASGKSK